MASESHGLSLPLCKVSLHRLSDVAKNKTNPWETGPSGHPYENFWYVIYSRHQKHVATRKTLSPPIEFRLIGGNQNVELNEGCHPVVKFRKNEVFEMGKIISEADLCSQGSR